MSLWKFSNRRHKREIEKAWDSLPPIFPQCGMLMIFGMAWVLCSWNRHHCWQGTQGWGWVLCQASRCRLVCLNTPFSHFIRFKLFLFASDNVLHVQSFLHTGIIAEGHVLGQSLEAAVENAHSFLQDWVLASRSERPVIQPYHASPNVLHHTTSMVSSTSRFIILAQKSATHGQQQYNTSLLWKCIVNLLRKADRAAVSTSGSQNSCHPNCDTPVLSTLSFQH